MKKILVCIILLLSLTACQKQGERNKMPVQTAVATSKSVPTQLFYSGTVSPLQVFNVVSPADGTVKEIDFKYGQKVNAGDKLFVISSSKLQDDYHTAFTNYLKATQDYGNAKSNFQGTQELFKAKIISVQEYFSDKSQYDSTALAYLSAKVSLEQLMKKIPGAQTIQLEKLSIDDVAAISKILEVQYSDLVVNAKNSGVALSPQKSASDTGGGTDSGDGSSDSDKSAHVGDEVKEGQTLVSIGDLSGISMNVQVSEMIINQIKTGQGVIVNLDAIPNVTFKGFVKAVGAEAQASQEGQGGVATFPVTIIVPQLTPNQMQLIRVGMTSKVQITIPNPAQIMIPIAAVYQKNGISTVTVVEPGGKQHEVPVVTGQTTLSEVAITDGLKAGDVVLVQVQQQQPAPEQDQDQGQQ